MEITGGKAEWLTTTITIVAGFIFVPRVDPMSHLWRFFSLYFSQGLRHPVWYHGAYRD
jgi:hypothetical protein